jgi:thiamine-monophosphate kinase
MREDDFVAAIRAIVEDVPLPRRVVLGIGDDAAVWQPSRSHLAVIASDALVDGVHFRWDAMSAANVGRRALAANLSDIAAMGARPMLATVSLGVPESADLDRILEGYRGMQSLARETRTRIVGGDVVRMPALTFAITVVGEVRPSNLKRRDGGRAGDVIAVTGALGASRAGLEVLLRSPVVKECERQAALAAYERPEPRLREGRWFGASANVHAMMDLSDGLSSDLARLARASGCGARIETIPAHGAARAVAIAAGDDPERYALDGGEDYELLVAIAPRAFGHLSRRFERHFGRPLLRIGALTSEPDLQLASEGGESPLVPAGWESLA